MTEKNKTQSDNKVPFYKKWWFWVIIVIVLIIGIAGGSSKDNNGNVDNTDSEVANGVNNEEKSDAESTTETRIDDPELNKIKFSISEVRNDVTGNWRVAVIAEPIVMSDHAVAYYQKYIKDDKEIHAIINFNKNTTTSIQNLAGMIYVRTLEYVKGEEHDAKKMFSGKLLSEEYFNPETGEEIKF